MQIPKLTEQDYTLYQSIEKASTLTGEALRKLAYVQLEEIEKIFNYCDEDYDLKLEYTLEYFQNIFYWKKIDQISNNLGLYQKDLKQLISEEEKQMANWKNQMKSKESSLNKRVHVKDIQNKIQKEEINSLHIKLEGFYEDLDEDIQDIQEQIDFTDEEIYEQITTIKNLDDSMNKLGMTPDQKIKLDFQLKKQQI